MRPALAALLIFCVLKPISAQLAAPSDSGVAMGHLHLNAKDVDAQKKFWVEQMSATAVSFGQNEAYKLPGVLIIVRKADPTGGSDGTVVDHVGFLVPDLKDFLAKRKMAGVKVFNEQPTQAFIEAPEGFKIEIQQDAKQTVPVKTHHIHFHTASVDDMQAWYVKTFSAKPGMRGRFQAADLPGMNLTFVKATADKVGTKGRSLDHIGFEVKNLEGFCKQLEAQGIKFDSPYRKLPNLNLAIAFFTDPWGTYIELTEGLDKL
jgi:catechol 2,3-dioxygenase-like lactoylglutathione lyase family enzyme